MYSVFLSVKPVLGTVDCSFRSGQDKEKEAVAKLYLTQFKSA